MARLTIEQVKAPDFSASSEMLARANESFNSGLESAKGILSKYNEGQQAKGDNALTQLLAGASSEEDLAKLLATTDISNMNISDTMRENYLGARTRILGDNATRQSTVNAADSNSRANAGEGRVAAEYTDGVAARDELRAMTPSYITALQEGQRNGYGASGNEREMLAATLQAEAGGEGIGGMVAAGAVIRNRAESGNYGGNTISGVIMKPGQFSAWNGVTGYAGGEGAIDMANLRVSEDAYKAADAILAGNYKDPTGGATHYYNPDVATPAWGQNANPGGGGWTTIGNHVFGNPDGVRASASGPAGTAPITRNGTGGEAAAAFTAALQAGTRMAPDQAAELFNSVLGQQAQGQSLIDAAEAKRQQEATAAAIIEAVRVGGSDAAVRNDLMNIDGVSAVNSVAAAATDLSPFGQLISPSINPDTEALSGMARARENDKITSNEDVFALAKSFDSGVNTSPVGTLFKEIGLDTKGSIEEITSYDNALAHFAEAAEVSPSEAAAALAVISRSGVDIKTALQLAPDQEQYGTIVSLINKQVGPEAKAAYEVSQGERSRREADRASAELQLSAAQSYAKKPGLTKVERDKAEAEVTRLRDSMVKGMTPQERGQNLVDYVSKTGSGSLLQSIQSDMAKYPEGTPQGDAARADFNRAMDNLIQQVEQDFKAGNITANEKELLLRDIRG